MFDLCRTRKTQLLESYKTEVNTLRLENGRLKEMNKTLQFKLDVKTEELDLAKENQAPQSICDIERIENALKTRLEKKIEAHKGNLSRCLVLDMIERV